jgi:dienelactone hydrolase
MQRLTASLLLGLALTATTAPSAASPAEPAMPAPDTAAFPAPAGIDRPAASQDGRGYCLFVRFLADALLLFPEWEPNIFDAPPVSPGPFDVVERRMTVDGADGCPLEITVFEPAGLAGAKPAFVWALGSNVQPHYHQSLHETLASSGYVVIVPETRPLTFIPDPVYHARNTLNALLATNLATAGALDVEVDPDRIAVGGYSIGGTIATFMAAVAPDIRGAMLWAPTSAPRWLGLSPENLWPQTLSPTRFLLGELDTLAPPDGFPADLQEILVNSPTSVEVIEGGTHLYFQQPTGADSPRDPPTDLTRFEQQAIAIEATRVWLNELLAED